MPMKKNSTPISAVETTAKLLGDSRRFRPRSSGKTVCEAVPVGPKESTLARLRQFARVAYTNPELKSLGTIVLN